MITVMANTRRVTCVSDDIITSGSIGLPVVFALSEEFKGLAVTAVFKGSDATVDVALTGDRCTVPPEVLARAKGYLSIGVCGRRADGTIAIPTIMAKVDKIEQGTVTEGADPAEPTPDWTAQVQGQAAEALRIAQALVGGTRATSLDATELAAAAEIVEAVGVPAYVDDVAQYAGYGLTKTGWYVFARIAAPEGAAVTEHTAVTGAEGAIMTLGADHVDVAVWFDVAAEAQVVTVLWDEARGERFVFKAPDLAVRNLDYRTTFYVYDIAPYVRWEYALTADAAFAADKAYFTEEDGVFSRAEVETVAYVLTADATFQAGKTYYTRDGETYSAAEVTEGEAVAEGTYYEQTTVAVPAYYIDAYTLTADATFQDGKTYYTEDGGAYTAAVVTPGEEVPAETYYEHSYAQATGTFAEGVAYYTKSGAEYTAAEVTAGEPILAYYNHSKLIFEGMTRNITYRLDEVVDCPQEYVLPEIEDDEHGCWFEIRLRHNGSFSSVLVVPEGVKVATEHTQAETAGLNMVDLHYSDVGGVKLWRFLNTHSTIPA